MPRSPLHPLPEMARAIHFVLRRGWAIPDLAVPLATEKVAGLVACRRLERAKESRQAFVAVLILLRLVLCLGLVVLFLLVFLIPRLAL